MRKHLIHINSVDELNGQAKQPPIGEVEYGELVVNYGLGHETIMLKNSNDEIISFKSDLYYSGTYATRQYVDEKIAEVEGGGGIDLSSYAQTAWTITQVQNAIKSANTYTDEAIAGIGAPTGVTEEIKEISGFVNTHTVQISELSGNSHTHGNKTVLDGINATDVSNWNTAFTNSHIHGNKDVLDGISDEDIQKWNDAEENVISAITVNNNALLVTNKGVNIDLTDYATHSYVDNKIVEIVGGGSIELDGYAKVEDVAQDFVNALQSAQTFADAAESDAVASAKTYIDAKIQASGHVHTNKTELDKVQNGDVEKWNNASTGLSFIIGSDTGKTIRQIATEELAAQLIPSGAQESLDTLQEIADWIQSHPDDASAMNTDIRRVSGWVVEVSAHVATIESTIANLDNRIQQVISAYITGTTNQISITDGGSQITVAFDENAIFGDTEDF